MVCFNVSDKNPNQAFFDKGEEGYGLVKTCYEYELDARTPAEKAKAAALVGSAHLFCQKNKEHLMGPLESTD
jgi:hypothetical protein